VWNDDSNINVYDLDSLQLKGSMRPAADHALPKEIQGMMLDAANATISVRPMFRFSPGGAVWGNDPRGLYLAVNGNCSVYRLDVRSGEVFLVLSDTYAKRPHEYEMEGITFWDLRKTGRQDLGEPCTSVTMPLYLSYRRILYVYNTARMHPFTAV